MECTAWWLPLHCTIYLKGAKKVNRKSPHNREKIQLSGDVC